MFRDRTGREIDVLTWSERFSDLDYRIVRDDLVVPLRLHVRTVWEGIDDLVGAMFATGVQRLKNDGAWSGFVTFAETHSEHDAMHVHQRIIAHLRSGAMPSVWSAPLWRLGSPGA